MVTFCVVAAFYNTLLTEKYKLREDEEEEVSSYWVTLTKREDGYWKEDALDGTLWSTRL